jgi:hypothetical protein
MSNNIDDINDIIIMSNNIDDINDIVDSAREIVQDDYIKSRLPQLTYVMTKLIEKYENDSLNVSERYTLITLKVLIENNQNLQ